MTELQTTPGYRWGVLTVIMLGTFMAVLDMSIVNVALPYMRANLGATINEVTWVSTGYIIAMVIVMPLTAWLSEVFGRKRLYLVCLLLFTAASFLCGASWSLVALIVFRMIQGFGAGVLQPVQQAILRETFPPHQQGLAMGIFAASSPLGFGAGPVLGAFMIDGLHLTSAAVFAVAAALSIGVALLLAVASSEVRPAIVPTGSTLSLASAAVRGVLSDPIVRWLFLVYGVVFVGRQMSAQYLVLLVHDVEHTSLVVAGSVGLVLGVAPLVGAACSPVGGWVADRIGFRPVMVASIAGISIAFAALPLAASVALLAVAYGVAIAFQTVVGAMVSGLLATEVPGERRSATLNLIYLPLYLGGITGPAIGAAVFTEGLRTVFYVAAGVLVLATLLALAFAWRTGGGRSNAAATAASPYVGVVRRPD